MKKSSGKFMCAVCPWRKYAERKPQALLARLWRWHTGWCPGWRAYQKSLADQAELQSRAG